MKNIDSSNEYNTPNSGPPLFMDRLFLKNSFMFYSSSIRHLFKYRKAALRNQYDFDLWVKSSHEMFEMIEMFGGCFRLNGLDNIRKFSDEPMVIISNHMSTLESLVFPAIIGTHKKLTFIVKEALLKSYLFGPIMSATDPIRVLPNSSVSNLSRIIKESCEKLEQGKSVMIFPEGSRQANFNPKRFSSVGIRIARKAGVRVLPVAIKTDFWSTGRILREFGKIRKERDIHFSFGKPIEVNRKGTKEHEQVIEYISSNLDRWNER
ncbi:MAG: lysophospholipid acyltransferase family protein [Leptospirales bacterium]